MEDYSGWRALLVQSVEQLAMAPADISARLEEQRFPVEELPLQWDDCYSVIRSGNDDAAALFNEHQLTALSEFDRLLDTLPYDTDNEMEEEVWDRANLDKDPWPAIRARANALLVLIR